MLKITCRMTKRGSIKMREFDDILQTVGSFGKYQKLRIAVLFVPISFFFGFTSTSAMFELVVLPHWCHVPGRENTSLSPEEWRNLTVPPKSGSPGKFSGCLMYDGYWETHNGTLTYTVTNNTKECTHGWEFDRSNFQETVPSALEWVCDQETFAHTAWSLVIAGRASGTFLLPLLADNYIGRRHTFFVALGTYVIFTLPLQWVTSAPVRFIFRFLQGTGFETNYLMPYVILMEIIPPNHRDFTLMLTFVAWTIGMAVMSPVAWLLQKWSIVSLVSIAPLLASFMYWWVLPESPRWLLSKGRMRECADILLQIGATNGAKAVSREEVEEELHILSLHMPPNEPLTRAFVYPKLRLRACMLFLLSFTQFIAYGVIALSMSVLPGNYFLSHVVLTIFEVPSVFVGLFVTHYFGRRCQGYTSLFIAAVCFTALPFCINHQWAELAVLAVAKLSVTCTLYLIFLLPSEILPTPVRTSGAGMTVVAGMIGMALTPHLLHSGLGEAFHYWVMLGLTIFAGICLWPLPETLGIVMPQTFLDGEELGRDRPLTTWIHHWNLHKYQSTTPPEQVEEAEDLMNGRKY